MIPKRGVTRQSSFMALRQTGGLCTIYSSVRCIVKLIKQFIPHRFIDNSADKTIARKMFKNLKSVFVNQPKDSCEITEDQLTFLEHNSHYEDLDVQFSHCDNESIKNNYALYSFLFDIARKHIDCDTGNPVGRFSELLAFVNFNNITMTMNTRETWYATIRDIQIAIPVRTAFCDRAYGLITEFNYFIKYYNVTFSIRELSVFKNNFNKIINEEKFMAIINNGFYATFSFFGCSSFWDNFNTDYRGLNNDVCMSLKCPRAINYRLRNDPGDGREGHSVVITNIDTYVDKLHTIWPSINLLNSWGKWGNNGQFNINKDNYECFYASNQTPIIIRYIEIDNFNNSRRRGLYVNDYNLFVQQLLEMAQNPIPDIENKVKEIEDREREEKKIMDTRFNQRILKNKVIDGIPFVKTRKASKPVMKDISNGVTLRNTRRSTKFEDTKEEEKDDIKELLLHAQNPVPSETKFEDTKEEEKEEEEDDDNEEEVDNRIKDMLFYAQYGTKLEKLEECAERGTTADAVKEQVNQFFRLPVETKKEILDKNAVNFQNKSDLCGEGNHFNLNFNKYIGQTKGGKNKSKIKRNKTIRLKCKSTRKKCRRRKQRRTTRKSDINMYYANR
jgi:hypothetical protein